MKIAKRELNNLRYYVEERERLLKEVDDYYGQLSNGYRSQDFTNLRTSKKRDLQEESTLKLIWHNERIQNEIKKRLKKIEKIIMRLYKIISKIENHELKIIVELRAIKGLTWEKIGEIIHGDPSNTRKKYVLFINGE